MMWNYIGRISPNNFFMIDAYRWNTVGTLAGVSALNKLVCRFDETVRDTYTLVVQTLHNTSLLFFFSFFLLFVRFSLFFYFLLFSRYTRPSGDRSIYHRLASLCLVLPDIVDASFANLPAKYAWCCTTTSHVTCTHTHTYTGCVTRRPRLSFAKLTWPLLRCIQCKSLFSLSTFSRTCLIIFVIMQFLRS